VGGIAGLRRFLERVYGLIAHIEAEEPLSVTRQLHKTIQKVGTDIVECKFNTAISAMMIFVNLAEKQQLTKNTYELFLRILAPFAPHLTEEIWHDLGHTTSIHLEMFPTANEALASDDEVAIGVQVNGKMRGTIRVGKETSEADALAAARAIPAVADKLATGTLTKVIYIPGKILNIVVA
jgi:leucyl-tRNA synthetase